MGLENPLPISSIKLKVIRRGNTTFFAWSADRDMCFNKFELQKSFDGENYFTIYDGANKLNYSCSSETRNAYFRIKAEATDAVKYYLSNIIFLPAKQHQLSTFFVADINGRIIKIFNQYPYALNGSINNHLSALPAGIYFIKEWPGNTIIKYFKR